MNFHRFAVTFAATFVLTASAWAGGSMTFLDGENDNPFTPTVVKGSANQCVGRFSLQNSYSLDTLSTVTITYNGTRSGATNFKLWASLSNTFATGTSTQIGQIETADPGDGESIIFYFSLMPGNNTYYFYPTVDVASNATGEIRAAMGFPSFRYEFSGGLNQVGKNLSTANVPLPVSISHISVE